MTPSIAAGAWTRAADGDATGEITPGATWFVEEGTTRAASTWRVSTTGTIVLGTTPITIDILSAAAAYTASNGVLLTGNNFTGVAAAGGLLTLGAGGFSVDKTKLMQGIALSFGNGTAGPFTLPHGFGTMKVAAEFADSASPFRTWRIGYSRADANNISVEPDIVIPAGAVTATISAVV